MLVQQQVHDVQTCGFEHIQAFQVKVNARLFQSAINGIYSDKIAAPLREVCSNAWDAHRQVGILDRPFQVKLPSDLDPVFRVRAFGPSLTHERMLGIYSTLNDTDKDGTNLVNGGFGLGCKSPFALVSSFSVTTWRDGQRRLYSCFIGEDGVPQIGSTKPYPSDEPTGLEVSFSVARSDIQKFRQKATEVLAAFDPLPIVLNEGFKIEVPEISASGNGWKLEKREGGPRVRMGCVFYPITVDSVYSSYERNPKCERANVTIDAPIGSLTMTPSRESLGYDSRTIAFLKAKLSEVDQHLWEECQRQIDAQATYAQAYIFLHHQIAGSDGRLWKDDKKYFKWQGKIVAHDSLETRRFDRSIFVPITYLTGRRSYDKKWKQSHSGLDARQNYSVPINRLADLLILVEPAGLDRVSRRKAAAIDANQSRHIVLVKDTPEFQAILEDLAEPEWQSLADYEPPPRQTSGQPSRYKGVSMPTRSVGCYHVYFPTALPQEGGIYVEQSSLSRDEVRCFGQGHKFEAFREFIKDAVNIGIFPEDTKVWIFNGRHQRVKRSENWKPIDQVITAWFKANFDVKAYKLEAQKRDFAQNGMPSFFHSLWKKHPDKSCHRLSRFAKQIDAILQSGFRSSYELEAMHRRCFPDEFDKIELKPLKLESDLAELMKRWPLFEILHHQDEALTLHYLSLIT
jgi:hypothetical protein